MVLLHRRLQALLLLQLLLSIGLIAWFGLPYLLALLCFAVLLLASNAVILVAIFARARRHRSVNGPRLQGAAARRLWRREYLAQLRLYLLGQPWRRLRAAPSGVDGDLLILVHGFFCNPGFFASWPRRLERDYQLSATSLELPYQYGNLYQAAAFLRDELHRLQRANPGARLHLIGHSMGGAAAVLAALRYPIPGVDHVLALAAPLHGTAFGDWPGLQTPGAPGQRGIADIGAAAREGCLPVDKALSVVFSWHDTFIQPPLNARLHGAHETAITGIGHLEMAYDSVLLNIVAERCLETARRGTHSA